MSRGKSTCKVLKEVRRKIADANSIPLEERECTHQGDCAGTCPYCEAEVRYLERELSKRKSLGKAVAVAGIALSAVTMAGCATSKPETSDSANDPGKTSGRPVTDEPIPMGIVTADNNGKPKAIKSDKKGKRKSETANTCDTYQIMGIVPMIDTLRRVDTVTNENQSDVILPSETDTVIIEEFTTGLVPRYNKVKVSDVEGYESIPGFTPAVFTQGGLEEWLSGQLQEFQSYMQESQLDSVEITFLVEEDGFISNVRVLNMPKINKPKDEEFRAKVIALISATEWKPATISGVNPVSSVITVRLRDLR